MHQGSTVDRLSTTDLALQRLDAGHIDTYEPGTSRERHYLNCTFRSDGDISKVPAEEKVEVIEDKEMDTKDAEIEWESGLSDVIVVER